MDRSSGNLIWNIKKELENIHKHGVSFTAASMVFKDPKRKIYIDSRHSNKEERYFCIGKTEDGILTVRFAYRGTKIRIFGAGYWRKGERYYEKED